jgi:GH15 family glucan-1,4-alpha-glucosidase
VGGVRNWDYRYTWIRDAAFTLYGLMRIGFTEEAGAFMNWLETSILSNTDCIFTQERREEEGRWRDGEKGERWGEVGRGGEGRD